MEYTLYFDFRKVTVSDDDPCCTCDASALLLFNPDDKSFETAYNLFLNEKSYSSLYIKTDRPDHYTRLLQKNFTLINAAGGVIENENGEILMIFRNGKWDFSQQPEFDKCEHKLNFMNRAIVDFVVKLSDCNGLSEHDRRYLSTTYRSVRDLERVGDYAENIVEYAQGLRQAGDSFSSGALEEIKELHSMVHSLYDVAIKAYVNESISLVSDANVIEEQIDDYTHKMEEFHIKRMGEGICTPTAGAQYLEFSSNTERIADHLMNVAKSVVNLKP